MHLEYVPLLRVQRELHGLPRGSERFQEYLGTTLNQDRTGVAVPPLLFMNPMGKEHMTGLLDALLALDADALAARALAELLPELNDSPGAFKLAIVVCDDVLGGWTNRYDYEYTLRFKWTPPEKLPRWAQDFWLPVVMWGSETPSIATVRQALRTAVYRAAYVQQHGSAHTLRARMRQEGAVMARAGCTAPTLEADDLDYTRVVLEPYLDSDDMRTTIECLFGDAAARTLGFTPRGLSPWAGIALALHEAQARCHEYSSFPPPPNEDHHG